jgi:hypothetical protein
VFFFHFSSFWPLLLHQCITFSFYFFKLSDLNYFEITILSSTNHISKGNRVIFKDFLRGLKIGYELFNWNLFCKNDPLTWGGGGCNFFTSYSFLPIFNAIDAPRGGLHLLFGHHKQWGLPAKMVSKPNLKWSLMGCFTLA